MATVARTRFELEGADGLPLRGEILTAEGGRHRPAVIICHGFKGFMDWGFYPQVAQRLARAGMTVVSFNFSGSGVGPDGQSFSEPARFGHATYDGDVRDILSVRSAVLDGATPGLLEPPTRIGLLGHGRGGGMAIVAAAKQENNFDALVTWAATADVDRWAPDVIERWRTDGFLEIDNCDTEEMLSLYTDILDEVEQRREAIDIEVAASKVRRPWLIVHGSRDDTVDPGEARRLHAASGSGVASMFTVEDGNHTFGMRHPWVRSTEAFEAALDSTVSWFVIHLM